MAVLSTLRLTGSSPGGGVPRASFVGSVNADPYPDYSHVALLAITGGIPLVDIVRPRTDRTQKIGFFKLTFGGTVYQVCRRLPGMTVTETRERSSFSFSVPDYGVEPPVSFRAPLGDPFQCLGVPLGSMTVDVDATLITSAGPKLVRLITNGLIENSSRAISGRSDVRVFNGVGPNLRYSEKLVTYTTPPGHGQSRGTVARRILSLAGATVAISGGGRMYKGMQMIDANAIAMADAILYPDLKKIWFNRNGQAEAKRLPPDDDQLVDWIFTEQDILDGIGSIGDSEAGGVPTRVTITGSKQITKDECGRITEGQTVETSSAYALPMATFSQNGAGVLAAVSYATPAETLQKTQEVLHEVTYECDTVVLERTKTWGYRLPETWRYELATDGSIAGYHAGCYLFDSGAVAGDTILAYQFNQPRWGRLTDVSERREFDVNGYLVKIVTESYGWYLPKRAVQSRASAATPWTDPNYIANVTVLGNGTGVSTSGEAYGLVTRETTDIGVTADGFVLRENRTTESWFAGDGWQYRYNGGFESDAVAESFGVSGNVDTHYMASTRVEGTHTTLVQTFDGSHKLVLQTITTNETGYLPAADKRSNSLPPDTTYDDPAQAEYAKAASRFESQPVKGEVTCSSLELNWIPMRESKHPNDWVESAEECYRLAEHELRFENGFEINFPLVFNPLIQPWHKVHLRLPRIGYDCDVYASSVQHTEGEKFTHTQVSAEFFPV